MTRSSLAAAMLALGFTAPAVAQNGQSFDRIQRGRYLAILGDCSACHTAPDSQPFAGGLALKTPFGTIVSSNITPDGETGIGNWSESDFVSAVRIGRGHNGARLYPAMPYTAYTKMTDEDVLAVRAYLATVAPVHKKVVSNQLPFPFNIRFVMTVWNALNFNPGRYQSNPEKSAEWNRGAYIVDGPGHCGTCHTPKTLLGGDKTNSPLAGGTLQGWFAPNITTDPHKGIGGWSKEDIVEYLKTGSNPWTLASGPMADAVSHSTSRMADEDIAAIATFLRDSGTVAPAAKPIPVAASDGAMRSGATIYKDNCAVCHRDSGTGESHLFPRLAGSALVQSDDPTTLVRVALQGSRAVATSSMPTAPAMPAFDWRLNDTQIAAVLTYIRNSWGNAAATVTPAAVESGRAFLAKSPE